MKERRTQQTNHGAALESLPLRERHEMTPVPMRADIALHGQLVRSCSFAQLAGSDLLAYAMDKLSLENAAFGGFDEHVDALVKSKVCLHHLTWIMKPLERLYDEMRKGVAA